MHLVRRMRELLEILCGRGRSVAEKSNEQVSTAVSNSYIYRLYDEKEGNTGFISPRKPMYRRPERAARGRLFRFPR